MLQDPGCDLWFRKNLRCIQKSLIQLASYLFAIMPNNKYRLTKRTFQKEVAILLYFLGSCGGYRETASVFGVSKSWAITIVHLLSELWERIEKGFSRKQEISGIVGAVDRTIIQFCRPEEYEGFYNRNGDPSLNIQAVCDHHQRFYAVDVHPGSYSDRKIWKCSQFGQLISKLLPTGCYIIGDTGYTLLPWLITPYLYHEEKGSLNQCQKSFNFKHSSHVWLSNAHLGDSRSTFMNETSLKTTVNHVMTCFVLHNILIDYEDNLFSTPDSNRFRNTEVYGEDNIDNDTSKALRANAKEKETIIAFV
ncbi:hypothetical protein THRCLA_23480 [Thraustotheca clavata]|uniref:DDE Tnp4 domain-containing protein n=1 Tax=Thraustotheca clavata TaxID=74557 RepID=A0A1V9Y459_9STRA|nr:hypothetical protein THRCLA_23480 [Thraustotheca clavata]